VARLDLVVLVTYLATTTAIGIVASYNRRTSDDLMAARRAVPGWAVGLSIFGTYVSNISFLALPSKAYATDWNAFAFSLAIPLSAWIAVTYFVPFYRRGASISSYEHLERRFGAWARTYAVACYLLTQFARVGTIMFLLALALAPLTGWSIPALIVLSGSVVIAYTLYGGITAVIWTDVVQSGVFIVGALACVLVILSGMPDGPGQAFAIAQAHGKFSFGSFGPSLFESTFWVVLVYGFFIDLQNFGIDQNYVQRYQTARSEDDARRSVWLGAMLYIPISGVFFFIGSALFAYYTAWPGRLPASTAATPDAVFPYFIAHQLPVGLVGLVVAALFAAAQSTISTSINSSATLVLCDIYQRYFQKNPTEQQKLAVLRVATVCIGLVGTGTALAMMRVRSALDAWWLLAGIFSGGMLGLFLLGRLSKRAMGLHALGGALAGITVILWMTFRAPFHSDLIIVFGTMTVILVGVLGQWIVRPPLAGSR
jgi:SSS family solute:Na+ symporter